MGVNGFNFQGCYLARDAELDPDVLVGSGFIFGKSSDPDTVGISKI